jgi:hypothetical protein
MWPPAVRRAPPAGCSARPRQIVTVREGEDIAPGLRLGEVATDHVVLERGGTREILAWPMKRPVGEAAAPRVGR